MRRFYKRGVLVVMERSEGPIGEVLCAVARCQCCGHETTGVIVRTGDKDQYVVCLDCIKRAAELFKTPADS